PPASAPGSKASAVVTAWRYPWSPPGVRSACATPRSRASGSQASLMPVRRMRRLHGPDELLEHDPYVLHLRIEFELSRLEPRCLAVQVPLLVLESASRDV